MTHLGVVVSVHLAGRAVGALRGRTLVTVQHRTCRECQVKCVESKDIPHAHTSVRPHHNSLQLWRLVISENYI